ncbi:hypothetical protein ASZ90_014515 [hydrocarbon metagenome]|uniref:Uncharacterized protein n=1 Tax=hydrocarbon metagenome TaxID=938273 RepID=A0A0W8F4Q2_9ZZZZ
MYLFERAPTPHGPAPAISLKQEYIAARMRKRLVRWHGLAG